MTVSAKRPGGAAVVVVGGGVTGLSTAWWLARSGIDVVVVEQGIVGWEASGRNGGGATHHYSPLFKEEQRLWPQLDDLLGYPTEFRPNRIRLAFDEQQMNAFEQAVRNGERQGFSSTWLDSKALRELVPIAAPDVLRAVFFHFGGHANPQRTVQAFAWAIQDLGGRIAQHTTVTGIRTQGGRAVAVETNRGQFACDALVLCAGVQTQQVAALVGARVPVAVARNEMIVTDAVPPMAHGGVDGNGLYGRQTLRGNLAYGGGPHEWLPPADVVRGAKTSTPLLGHLARRLARMFPAVKHVRVLRAWSGLVENTPDGRPIIDRLAALDNVAVATMSSIGFGLSPASGRAIAELVQYGECRFADISSFSLSRFSNLERDWQAERGWVPVPDGADSNFADAPSP
ncbi:MAG: FAD-binding oxidoreductase [Betaproteobacteria bacterium]